MDPCQCCAVCGRLEGELCDPGTNPDLPLIDSAGVIKGTGRCGDNLQCQIVEDQQEEAAEQQLRAVCVCRELEMVCGSNGQSFDNLCRLMEHSFSGGQENMLRVESWGPCETAPEIITEPREVLVERGTHVNIDCEVRGYPIPEIFWRKTQENGNVTPLPGFWPNVSVQTRGGPTVTSLTSWVQIFSVQPSHSGRYTCSAANKYGLAKRDFILGVFAAKTRVDAMLSV